MAHITEFNIDGLAGRDGKYHKVLNRDTNIFFGLNGSGKTSLLKILHSALNNDADILVNVPFKKAVVKIYSLDYDKVFTRSIQSLSSGDDLSVIYEDTEIHVGVKASKLIKRIDSLKKLDNFNVFEKKYTWITEPSDIETRGFSHRYLPTSRLYVGPDGPYFQQRHREAPSYSTAKPSETTLDDFFAKSLDRLWNRYNSKILQKVRKAQENGLVNILKAIISRDISNNGNININIDKAYNSVSSFLERQGSTFSVGNKAEFSKRLLKDAQLKSIVLDIYEVEKQIEEAMAPRVKLQELIDKMFIPNKNVTFTDDAINIDIGKEKKKIIKISSLSSGEKQALLLFVECLLAENNTIIIDEPELSLHIDWQKTLMTYMNVLNQDAQYIVATHSPEIMADIPDKNVFSL